MSLPNPYLRKYPNNFLDHRILPIPEIYPLMLKIPLNLPLLVIFVNSVWIVSLVLSFTCALMATFLQQWTRRYL